MRLSINGLTRLGLPLRFTRCAVIPAGRTPCATTTAEATATTTEATTASATETATPATTLFAGLGLRFVHADRPTVQIRAIERGDSGIRFLGVRHLNEAEALGAVGHAVNDHTSGGNLAKGGEGGAESIVVRRIGKIANIDIHRDTFLTGCR